MRITIDSTPEVTRLDGVPCRVWKGVTAAGTECVVFVHRVCAAEDSEFDQLASEGDLQVMPPPNFDALPEPLQ